MWWLQELVLGLSNLIHVMRSRSQHPQRFRHAFPKLGKICPRSKLWMPKHYLILIKNKTYLNILNCKWVYKHKLDNHNRKLSTKPIWLPRGCTKKVVLIFRDFCPDHQANDNKANLFYRNYISNVFLGTFSS